MPAAVKPVLFEVFGVKVYSHPFFLALGIVVLLVWVAYEARRRNWPLHEIVPIGLAGFVGAMVGARLSILFVNGPSTAPIVLDFYTLFDPGLGPSSVLGAIAGAYIAGYVASRAIGTAGSASCLRIGRQTSHRSHIKDPGPMRTISTPNSMSGMVRSGGRPTISTGGTAPAGSRWTILIQPRILWRLYPSVIDPLAGGGISGLVSSGSSPAT